MKLYLKIFLDYSSCWPVQPIMGANNTGSNILLDKKTVIRLMVLELRSSWRKSVYGADTNTWHYKLRMAPSLFQFLKFFLNFVNY